MEQNTFEIMQNLINYVENLPKCKNKVEIINPFKIKITFSKIYIIIEMLGHVRNQSREPDKSMIINEKGETEFIDNRRKLHYVYLKSFKILNDEPSIRGYSGHPTIPYNPFYDLNTSIHGDLYSKIRTDEEGKKYRGRKTSLGN